MQRSARLHQVHHRRVRTDGFIHPTRARTTRAGQRIPTRQRPRQNIVVETALDHEIDDRRLQDPRFPTRQIGEIVCIEHRESATGRRPATLPSPRARRFRTPPGSMRRRPNVARRSFVEHAFVACDSRRVVVSQPHRFAAISATRYVMNRLTDDLVTKVVPIRLGIREMQMPHAVHDPRRRHGMTGARGQQHESFVFEGIARAAKVRDQPCSRTKWAENGTSAAGSSSENASMRFHNGVRFGCMFPRRVLKGTIAGCYRRSSRRAFPDHGAVKVSGKRVCTTTRYPVWPTGAMAANHRPSNPGTGSR